MSIPACIGSGRRTVAREGNRRCRCSRSGGEARRFGPRLGGRGRRTSAAVGWWPVPDRSTGQVLMVSAPSGWFRFAGFESGDVLGGGPGNLGDQAVVVVDAPGVVSG